MGCVGPVSLTLPFRPGDVRGRRPAVDAVPVFTAAVTPSSLNDDRAFRNPRWDAVPVALLVGDTESGGVVEARANEVS